MTRWLRILIPAIALVWLYSGVHAADDFALRRARMVKEIAALTADTGTETGRHAIDARVMAAMEQVPRHKFVPPEQEHNAYENRPLPIGYGQTISQPYIVALMTDLMVIKSTDIVLEVGTGSGYQAAILAGLARAVYSIEIVEPLGTPQTARLQASGNQGGRRLLRVGSPRALRRHHRHRRCQPCPSPPRAAIEAGRQNGYSGGRAVSDPVPAADRKIGRRNDFHQTDLARQIRAIGRALIQG
jgi:hypothetical protein